MKSLIRKIAPKNILNAYRICRSHRKALAVHKRLIECFDQNLSSPSLDGCKILANREEMLRRLPDGGVVVEVGVATGDFSRTILEICRPRKLILIDLWGDRETVAGKVGGAGGYNLVSKRFTSELAKGVVEMRKGYSTQEMNQLPDGSVDWIYIDAAHDYENVKNDLAAARRIVKQGGFICGHDYTRWGSKGLARFGVVEAVNEFCNLHGLRICILTNEPHRHISYAIGV